MCACGGAAGARGWMGRERGAGWRRFLGNGAFWGVCGERDGNNLGNKGGPAALPLRAVPWLGILWQPHGDEAGAPSPSCPHRGVPSTHPRAPEHRHGAGGDPIPTSPIPSRFPSPWGSSRQAAAGSGCHRPARHGTAGLSIPSRLSPRRQRWARAQGRGVTQEGQTKRSEQSSPGLQRPGFRSMYLYGLRNAVGV